jgi:hypothetical protein
MNVHHVIRHDAGRWTVYNLAVPYLVHSMKLFSSEIIWSFFNIKTPISLV